MEIPGQGMLAMCLLCQLCLGGKGPDINEDRFLVMEAGLKHTSGCLLIRSPVIHTAS